jgi:hypothetical protein
MLYVGVSDLHGTDKNIDDCCPYSEEQTHNFSHMLHFRCMLVNYMA